MYTDCGSGVHVATILVRQNGNIVVTMRLTIQPQRDEALIDFVQNAPKGALAGLVREAMRTGISSKIPVFEENPEDIG
jgi:hypothetical protein